MFSKILYFILPYLFTLSVEAKISCEKYTEFLENQKLHEIIPRNTPEEKRCEMIPKDCGRAWLLFNPARMKTFYFKSACYYDLAIKNLEKKYCHFVKERKSFFLDGSYYSPSACSERIETIKRDALATKIPSSYIHRLHKIAYIIKDGEFIVEAILKDANISGKYALSVMAFYHKGKVKVQSALNPKGEKIVYDESFKRFYPVNNWILSLNAHQKSINFVISKNNFTDILKALTIGEVKLRVSLQFLESRTGEIADPKKRKEYISEVSTSLGEKSNR